MPNTTQLPNSRMLATLAAAALLGAAGAGAQTLPSLTSTPAALAFTYTLGATQLPVVQSVTVKSSVSATPLDFTVAVSPAAPWLIVTPASGTTSWSLTARVNPTGLGAGSYTSSIVISSAGAANSPISVLATLVVKNPPPTMAVSPASLAFSYATDDLAPPADQTLTISTNGEPLSFTAAATGGTWLRVTPASGISLLGSPIPLTVSADPRGRLPGAYTGRITIASGNALNKSVTVAVTMTVVAGTAVLASIWPLDVAVGSPDTTITLVGSHLFPASVVHVGATAITSTWIGPEALMAVVPATLLSSQGTLAVTVTNAPRPASNALNWSVTTPGPRIWAVANAASFAVGDPTAAVAPGEIVAIFGSGLGPATALISSPSGGAYPTTLETVPETTTVEVEVSAGSWVAAPIILAQAGQVNAVVPFSTTASSGRKIRVTCNGVVSSTYTVDGQDSAPGIFTMDSSGRGQAAVLNYNSSTGTYSLNSSSNPAAKGSIVVIYATGGGVTSVLPSPEGQVVPLSGPPRHWWKPPVSPSGLTPSVRTMRVGRRALSPGWSRSTPRSRARRRRTRPLRYTSRSTAVPARPASPSPSSDCGSASTLVAPGPETLE